MTQVGRSSNIFYNLSFELISGPRTSPRKVWLDLDQNCYFDCILPERIYFEKVNFEKSQQAATITWKITQHA